MARLARSFATQDVVPEALRDYYVKQDDGTYAVDVEGGAEDVTGLRTTVAKLRGEIKDYKKQLAAFDGMTPEQLEELREKADSADANQSDVVKDLNKKLTAATKALEKATGINTSLKTQLTGKTLEADALKEIEAAGGNATVLLPHILGRSEVVFEDDGSSSTIVVKDAKGVALDGKTLKDLVGEYKANPAFSGNFTGTGVSGSGAQPTAPGSGTRGASNAGTSSRPVDADMDAKRATGNYSI